MPLVIVCGTPLSGKSHRADQLFKHFRQSYPTHNIVLVSDEDKYSDFGGRNQVYSNANLEKELRGWLKSEVQRHLSSKTTIVILDAANYIKGYRYELNCLVKEKQTTQALLECEPPETIDENQFCANEQDEMDNNKYTRSMFSELIQRYEEPNASNRWDSPLFRVEPDSPSPPFQDIASALLSRKPAKPNKSTQCQPLTTDNFMLELDNQTQSVIRSIQLALDRRQLTGIQIPESSIPIHLKRSMCLAELNKLRRQFLNYQKISQNSAANRSRLTTAFVQFINKSSET